MISNPTHLHKVILAVIILIAVVLGVAVFITPAALFPDPSWGFQVMRSMEFGGSFNILVKPDPADISKNTADFLTWWSPGQYLYPYLFKILFGLNTGQAMAVVTSLCTATGLFGLYAFFKKAGFTPMISTLSLLFIMCQQAFFSPYIFYNGGEVLLFAFLGWFLYGCMTIDKPGLKLGVFVLLAGWLGFICKSSFIWMYAAGLIFIWIRLCEGHKTIKGWVLKGLWPGIPAVISVTCIYIFYLSKGNNPSSESGSLKLTWETFSFPLASPLLSGFSADELFNGLIYHNDAVLFSHHWAVIIVLLSAILSVVLLGYILKSVPNRNYRLMLLVFYTVSALFFGYAYLRQMNISYESRHFRLIGLLVTPGVVYLFWHAGRVYQITLGAITLLIAFFSASFYIEGYQRLQRENIHGPSGIAQQFIDKEALDYITRLDQTNTNALFVFTSPDLGLEIMHNRFITLQPLNGDISINFDEYVHKGHSGPLYIMLPSKYIGVRASVFLKCFPGYKAFTLKEVSDEYVVYSSNTYR